MKGRLIATASTMAIETSSSVPIIFQPTGTEAMRIDTSGNVGIGTVPESFAKLEVKTSTDKNIAIFDNAAGPTISAITDAGASQALRIAGQTIIMTGAGGSGAEHMRIDSNGNVGIGGNIDNHGGYARCLQITGAGESAIELENSTGYSFIAQNGANLQLKTVANGAQIFYTNNTERLRITSGGNVGIGTASPNYKLDVQAANLGTTSGDTVDVLQLYSNVGNASYLNFQKVRTSTGSGWPSAYVPIGSGAPLPGLQRRSAVCLLP